MKEKCDNCELEKPKYRVSVTDMDGVLLDSTMLCQECFEEQPIANYLSVGVRRPVS